MPFLQTKNASNYFSNLLVVSNTTSTIFLTFATVTPLDTVQPDAVIDVGPKIAINPADFAEMLSALNAAAAAAPVPLPPVTMSARRTLGRAAALEDIHAEETDDAGAQEPAKEKRRSHHRKAARAIKKRSR